MVTAGRVILVLVALVLLGILSGAIDMVYGQGSTDPEGVYVKFHVHTLAAPHADGRWFTPEPPDFLVCTSVPADQQREMGTNVVCWYARLIEAEPATPLASTPWITDVDSVDTP
jgi:hypothetical protein